MYLTPQLIKIINPFLSGEKSKSRFHAKKVYFSKYLKTYFSCNINSLRKPLNLSIKDVLQIYLYKERKDNLIKSEKRIIIKKSLNGVVIFNLTDKCVIKVINRFLEPEFLKNALRAKKLLPNNVPDIKKSGEKGSYFYLISQFYKKDRIVKWEKWNETLEELTPIFSNLYSKSKLYTITPIVYIEKIVNKLDSIVKGKDYLVDKFNQTSDLLKKCLSKYYVKDVNLYKKFSHGDLVPNNIIETKNEFYICDWANGGIQNIFYDLMMQNFYNPEAVVWKNFKNIDFTASKDKDIFFGWAVNYIKIFEKVLASRISNAVLRFSMIVSLAELAVKNFLRYQSLQEYHDGEKMLDNVYRICKNILDSD